MMTVVAVLIGVLWVVCVWTLYWNGRILAMFPKARPLFKNWDLAIKRGDFAACDWYAREVTRLNVERTELALKRIPWTVSQREREEYREYVTTLSGARPSAGDPQ